MLLHSGASPLPGLAGYGEGWDQRGFDRVHVATLEAAAYTLYVPVGFRHASGAEVMLLSAFEIPPRRLIPEIGIEEPPTSLPLVSTVVEAEEAWML